MVPCRYRQPRPLALQPECYVPSPKSSGVAEFCYFQSPSRGPIVSYASAASEVFVRVWLRGADSSPQARFFPLLTGAIRMRSTAGRHGQTQRNFILGGAVKPCCQPLPRLLNGALQVPSFAAASASTALRTSAWVVECCRGLLLQPQGVIHCRSRLVVISL